MSAAVSSKSVSCSDTSVMPAELSDERDIRGGERLLQRDKGATLKVSFRGNSARKETDRRRSSGCVGRPVQHKPIPFPARDTPLLAK